MIDTNLSELLNDRYQRYNVPGYIDEDPIQIPHLFSSREDIEIAAFLSASIAWGLRKTIIRNGLRLMELMDMAPYDFVRHAGKGDWRTFEGFVHRTFNGTDCVFFLQALQNIYRNHQGLEAVFNRGFLQSGDIAGTLQYFREVMLEVPHVHRSEKHVADVGRKATAKRLNMFLRWMVRTDNQGVDFGLWKHIPASALMLPLDVHTGNVGRAIGVLQRQQNDWQAVEEITDFLRLLDPNDPVKYDFALFGMGLNKELK
jgi:uncharacterized protein (TIGR02757 family)